MRIDSSGNVGIGTVSPSYNLDISNSSGEAQLRIDSSAGNHGMIRFSQGGTNKSYIQHVNGNHLAFGPNGSEAMRIDSVGNVSIGNSSPETDATHHILTLAGKSSNGAGGISFVDTSSNVDAFIFADTGSLFLNADYDNATADSSIRFRVDGSSEKMRIDSSGRVGIGTSSPDRIIHCHNSSNTTNVRTKFSNGTTGQGASDGFEIGINASNPAQAVLVNNENSPMAFFTNATEKMHLTSKGGLRTLMDDGDSVVTLFKRNW